jgi:hypothetical protein
VGDQPLCEPKETEAAPLFLLARNKSRIMRDLCLRKKKKIKKNKERKCKLIFQVETQRGKKLVLKKGSSKQ